MATAEELKGVASYYLNMTRHYNAYSNGAYGWHYGIYEGTTRTAHQAILNSNRRIVSGMRLGPGARILDLGCGVGGFATWAAKELGCFVTGITIVQPHIEFAQRLAAKKGVGHLCNFILMNMEDLQFDAERFDLIVNQETLCHVTDKPALFRRVYDLLKPNGRWQSVDFSIKEGPLSAAEQQLHQRTCENWFMPPLAPASAIAAATSAANFVDHRVEDLTPLVLKSARRVLRACWIADRLMKLKIDKLLFRDQQYRADLLHHFAAGSGYSEGLIQNMFRHHFYSATKATS